MSNDPNTTPKACPRCGASVETAGARFCRTCGAALALVSRDEDPLIGRTVLGRYTVERVIGEGGMGRVYIAEQRIGRAARKVAVKALSPSVSRDPTVVARFQREAATILELNHPSTVRLYDFGEEGGQLFLAMEYIAGLRLAEALARGPLPPSRAVAIAVQIAGSLDEAHRRGVIHRDLKPENVILQDDGSGAALVKVVDFGIAKHVDHSRGDPTITARGTLVGTPAYMSPEQFTGLPVDGRSDVYALGLLTYKMLSGSLPWSAKNVYEWASRHVAEPVPPLESRAPGLPPRVYAAVERALAKSPGERFATAADFARELAGLAPGADPWTALATGEIAAGASGAISPAAAAAVTPPSAPSATTIAARMPRPPGGRRPWALLAALFVATVALGFGAVALYARRGGPSRASRREGADAAGARASGGAGDGGGARADASPDGGAADDAPTHPNWSRAEPLLMDGQASADRGDLTGALDALEAAQDLIGPTSIKLAALREASAVLGARAVRARLAARRCADAQALARRLRRVGAEGGDVHSLFGRGCAAP